MLYPQIDAEADRFLLPVDAEAGAVQVGRPRLSIHFSRPAMPWLSMLTRPTTWENSLPFG